MSSSASLSVTSQTNGPVLYQVFERRLKEHYPCDGHDLVELALNALREEASWNQKMAQIKNGTISVPDQILLEKKVQLLLGRLTDGSLREVSEQKVSREDVAVDILQEALLPPGEEVSEPAQRINNKGLAIVALLGSAFAFFLLGLWGNMQKNITFDS